MLRSIISVALWIYNKRIRNRKTGVIIHPIPIHTSLSSIIYTPEGTSIQICKEDRFGVFFLYFLFFAILFSIACYLTDFLATVLEKDGKKKQSKIFILLLVFPSILFFSKVRLLHLSPYIYFSIAFICMILMINQIVINLFFHFNPGFIYKMEYAEPDKLNMKKVFFLEFICSLMLLISLMYYCLLIVYKVIFITCLLFEVYSLLSIGILNPLTHYVKKLSSKSSGLELEYQEANDDHFLGPCYYDVYVYCDF
jgi:4-amino-4-deoxy-L-arabinose transferase-like glycosyltransferase